MGNFIESLRERFDDSEYPNPECPFSAQSNPILITPQGALVYKHRCFELCGDNGRCLHYDGEQYQGEGAVNALVRLFSNDDRGGRE